MINYSYGTIELGPLRKGKLWEYQHWRNNSKVSDYCRQVGVLTEADQEDWWDMLHSAQGRQKIRMFEILNPYPKTVGVCGLTGIDSINRTAEFSLYIAPEFQGMKLGKPALQTLLHFGFESMNLNRIWGEVFDFNERALACFTSLGMAQEARLRQTYWKKGIYHDSIIVSLLRKEWYLRKEKQMTSKEPVVSGDKQVIAGWTIC